MLWQLNVSHVGVGPAEVWPSVEPVVWGAGEIGVDIRLLKEQAVITRVEDGSPAEQAGLRPGFILQRIAGLPVEQILAEMEGHLAPPYNPAGKTDILTRNLLSLIYGEPGDCVTLTYLDEQDAVNELCVERAPRLRKGEMGDIIPPAYLEFESRRLEGGYGYIRFNSFHQDLVPDLVEAVAELQDAPGIISDLRGNPGGDPIAAETMAAQFLAGETSFGSFKFRGGDMPRLVSGENVFSGPLVILIDAMSFSGSEYFSSGMQLAGRAVIIGDQSPGGLTGMNFKVLSNGALLGYPVIQLISADGRALEGVGVIPDQIVPLERSQLLVGIDAQLRAAVEYLNDQAQ